MSRPLVKPFLAAALGCVALLVTACSPIPDAVEPPGEVSPPPSISPPFDVQAVMRRMKQAFRPEAGGFTGEQSIYTVRVGQNGTIHFTPRHANALVRAGGPRAVEHTKEQLVTGRAVEVRTSSISRGGQPLSRAVRTSVREDGSLALERGPVVEVLQNAEEGMEQRWELASMPPGSGPLEVRVELAGLEYVGRTEGGHHYVDRQSGLGVRYGEATWVDARGMRHAVETTREGGELVLRVPARVLEGSAWPAVLDPIISPEFGPDSPVQAPTFGTDTLPRVASCGGLSLAVWGVNSSTGWDVRGTRIRASDGVILDINGITLGSGTGDQSSPAVACNGNEFMVVWQDVPSINQGHIYGVRVNGSTGKLVDTTPIRISLSDTSQQSYPVIAFDGTHYLIVWSNRISSSWSIQGARVRASTGTLLDTTPISLSLPTGTQGPPDVAAGGGNFLVVWTDNRSGTGTNIYGARLRSTDGVVLDSGGVALSSAPGSKDAAAIAYSTGTFLVTWNDNRADTGYDIYGTRVRASDGAVLDPSGIPIGTGPLRQGGSAIGVSGNRFLVAWHQSTDGFSGDIHGVRLDTDGQVLDTSSVPLATSPTQREQDPAVAFDGTHLLLLWMNDNPPASPRYDIYGTRLKVSNLEVVDTPPQIFSSQANSENSPAVAAGGNVYLMAWSDSRDRDGSGDVYGVRVRASDGTVLDPAAIRIAQGLNHQGPPSVAFDGSNFLVVWLDYRDRNTTGQDIYGARVRASDGVVLDPAGIPICTVSGHQAPPAVAFGDGVYFVTWNETGRGSSTGQDIYGARVRPSDGVVLDPGGFAVSNATLSQSEAVVAAGGGLFLVTWTDERNGTSNTDIYGARVRAADGVVLDKTGIAISSAADRQYTPDVAFDGSNFLTVWQDRRSGTEDLYGARVRASDGAVLDGTGLVLRKDTISQKAPALAFDGTTYLMVWKDMLGLGAAVQGLRIKPDGTLLDGTGFLIDNQPQSQTIISVPAVAAQGPGRFLVLYDEFDDVLGQSRFRAKRVSDPASNASVCASGGECLSTYCVGGFCCDSACPTGTCETGTCSTAPPSITCPADVVAEAASSTGVVVSYPPATATGRAPLTLTYSKSTGTSFALGTTPVTATATDGAGRTSSCTFNVTVRDTTAPTLSCPSDLTVDATSTSGATVTYPPATASDAVSTVKVSSTPASGSHFNVGTTPVNVSATDEAGNTSSCGFNVTVRMPPAPQVTCPADAVAEATSASGALVDYPAATATGTTPLSLAYSQDSGTRFVLGTTPVTATVTDGLGRTASCVFSVTVRDTAAPTLLCGADMVAEATSPQGAAVSYALPSATDAVTSTPDVSASPASGSTFPLGTTPVTVTATDAAGNSATCTFRVTVRDSTAPTITCPQDVTAEAASAEGAVVDYPPATTSDATSSPTLHASQDSGTRFVLGRTDVTVTATDGAGNVSSCVLTVTVRDSTPPALTCGTDLVAEATRPEGALVDFSPPTATDAVTAEPLLTSSHASGGLFPPGTTRVTVTATDSANNVSTCSFTITVQDTTPPEVGCPGPITVEAESAAGSQVVFSVPAPRDAVTRSPSVSSSHAPGSLFPPGTTSVVLSASDEAGNTSSCTFGVTVQDTTLPVLTCPADVQVENAPAQGVAVDYPAASASDTASTPELSYSHASGEVFPVGTTQVTATATDGSGNSATCSFQVRVNPSVSVPAPAVGCGCGAGSSTAEGLSWGALMVLTWGAARRRARGVAGEG